MQTIPIVTGGRVTSNRIDSTRARPRSSAFTVTELIVIAAVLATLAALILPVLSRAKLKAQIQLAYLQITQIDAAIEQYESTYGRLPVSGNALAEASLTGDDFTYGAIIEETHQWLAGPGGYLTNNAEVMCVLLDLEKYGTGLPTVNKGHVRNPQRIQFITASIGSRTNAAVGIDGVYRDPWGCPYIVSLDLNNDGFTRDVLYRHPAVSQDSCRPDRGLNGLTRTPERNGKVWFELNRPTMVWSAGPDKHVDMTIRADQGVNRDNLLSWKR